MILRLPPNQSTEFFSFMSPSHSDSGPSALPRQARELDLGDLDIGLEAEYSWLAEGNSIDDFANLSGDKNPLHMDETYARDQGYDGRVVHGFLLGARISGLIGMVLPGRRCLLLEEKLAFPAPVYIGDEVVFHGVIEEVHHELAVVILKILAKKMEQTVMRGRVTCKLLS
jgi:acyl dehydratase